MREKKLALSTLKILLWQFNLGVRPASPKKKLFFTQYGILILTTLKIYMFSFEFITHLYFKRSPAEIVILMSNCAKLDKFRNICIIVRWKISTNINTFQHIRRRRSHWSTSVGHGSTLLVPKFQFTIIYSTLSNPWFSSCTNQPSQQ